jgi:hypothetical protein
MQNEKELFCLLPHSSHALQSLEVAVFCPLKPELKNSHNEWLQSHPGQRNSIKEVAFLCKILIMQNIVAVNIGSGFEKTGIFPFDYYIIPELRYAPAIVTDRLVNV